MSSNWNVYKLFKNGKRAKAPMHTFVCDGTESEANEFFNQSEIKILVEKYGEKIKKFDFKIVNSEQSQERVESDAEDVFTRNSTRILASIINQKNINTKRKLGGGLIYSKKSNWKWQWAALEAATNNYIEGLSEPFESYEEAIDWMKEKITTL